MPFIPDHFQPPRQANLAGFSLAVLSPQYVKRDFAAVCASADSIRHAFGPDKHWPSPSMSFEENEADLVRHEAEFDKRYAFAYAVLAPELQDYLSCLYLKPIKSKHGRDRRHALFGAQAFLWMSALQSRLTDSVVQAEIDKWLCTAWPISKVAWPGRIQSWDEWRSLANSGFEGAAQTAAQLHQAHVDASKAMHIRPFRPGEESALHQVFHSAVHGVASRDYSAEQIQAWAPANLDQQVWTQRMQGIRPFVVERNGAVIAYADLQPSGYIDHFFVSADHAGQGVGTLLMKHLHALAIARSIAALSSDVSRTAQAFFAKFGFVIVEQRSPVVRGVVVPNALMRKQLAPNFSIEPIGTQGLADPP